MSNGFPQRLVLASCAVLAAALVHSGSLDNPFVYDDHKTVLGNPSLVDPGNLPRILLHIRFRPVTNLSYAFDSAVWGLEPFGFHLTNLLLHLIVTALVFTLIDRALADRRQVGHEASLPDSSLAALAGTSLFALHPLTTEAVGYVSARSELLAAGFVLIALLCARRWLVGGRAWWLVPSVSAFVVGLASKETAAVFPFLLLAYDRWIVGAAEAERRRRLLRIHLPLISVVTLAAMFRLLSFATVESTELPRSITHNLLTQAVVVWRYLGLWLWPANQSLVHPAQSIESVGDLRALIAASAILVAVAVAVLRAGRAPLTSLGTVWFFLALAPSSSLVPLNELMAEHRTYLALIGLSLIVIEQWQRLRSRWRDRQLLRRLSVALLLAVIALLGALSVQRARVWADPLELWSEAVRRAPRTFAAHFFLAEELHRRDRCEEALPIYSRAATLLPSEAAPWSRAGVCMAKLGRHDQAFAAFRKAIEIDPDSATAHTHLGYLMAGRGRHRESEQYFRRALEIERDPQTLYYLAMLVETAYGDSSAALALCQEGMDRSVDPDPRLVECIERNRAASDPEGSAE